jgi:hypothetical protein
MKKIVFKLLASINKVLLPSYGRKDLTKLKNKDKLIIAYRYWVTRNVLDN